MSRSSRWVACTAVEWWPERAGLVEQLGRGRAVEHLAGEVLAVLLGQVHVERQVARGLDDLGQVLAPDRPHRVDRRTEPHPVGLGAARRHALGPRLDGAVAEPALAGVQLDVAAAVEPTLEVAGVEQRQPDAGLVGGLAHGETHGVRVAVGVAARAVVDVVELPHRR